MFADFTIGYDPGTEQIFAEVKDESNQLHRIVAGKRVTKGVWFDVCVKAKHNPKSHKSTLTLYVKSIDDENAAESSVTYKGYALKYNVSRWVVGMAFPEVSPTRCKCAMAASKILSSQALAKQEPRDKIQSLQISSPPILHAL